MAPKAEGYTTEDLASAADGFSSAWVSQVPMPDVPIYVTHAPADGGVGSPPILVTRATAVDVSSRGGGGGFRMQACHRKRAWLRTQR